MSAEHNQQLLKTWGMWYLGNQFARSEKMAMSRH